VGCNIDVRECKSSNILELHIVIKYDYKYIYINCTRKHPNVIYKYEQTTLLINNYVSSNDLFIYNDLYEYTPKNGTYLLDNVKYNNFIEIKNIIIKQFNDILLPELLNIILDYMLQDVKLMI
jgi:hypothetical protein